MGYVPDVCFLEHPPFTNKEWIEPMFGGNFALWCALSGMDTLCVILLISRRVFFFWLCFFMLSCCDLAMSNIVRDFMNIAFSPQQATCRGLGRTCSEFRQRKKANLKSCFIGKIRHWKNQASSYAKQWIWSIAYSFICSKITDVNCRCGVCFRWVETSTIQL